MVEAYIFGPMVEDSKENGKKTICMAKDYTHGRMVEDIKESI